MVHIIWCVLYGAYYMVLIIWTSSFLVTQLRNGIYYINLSSAQSLVVLTVDIVPENRC